MSATVTHSIGKISFHLKGVETGKVFTMRQHAASYLQHDFVRMAEDVFDEFALNDELLFIQKLSIDLQIASDSFDLKKQEYHLREQIREQIVAQVQKQKNNTFAQTSTGVEQKNDARTPDVNLLLKAWAFYLERGYLPAYMSFVLWHERLSWWKKTFVQSTNQLKQFLISQLSDEQRLKRFLKHEPSRVQQWIFEQLHPELHTLLETGSVRWNRTIPFSHFELKTYLQFLLSEKNSSVLLNEEQLPSVEWVMHHHETYNRSSKQLSTELKEVAATKNVSLQTDQESIIIHNAGIVLLQPFISTLFNELHILSEDRKSITDKQKACALLSVLAGDAEQDEIYYPLYKLLCGVPMHEVIDGNVQLTTEEREECFHLLQQVIVHWPALKQSSVPSLQQIFLQRTGKLSHKEDKWLLQVEQRTEDVLMQYLPWTYSIIRYPWMKQALFVEWT
ncbi:contractile injection system tape measure protein [Lacibacter sp. H375]|uniref:contractile injection system tape measure protein n=1 Tax=Lacibacter sp. H375 TaxID=3133424 RepID=UPI0030C171A5